MHPGKRSELCDLLEEKGISNLESLKTVKPNHWENKFDLEEEEAELMEEAVENLNKKA